MSFVVLRRYYMRGVEAYLIALPPIIARLIIGTGEERQHEMRDLDIRT